MAGDVVMKRLFLITWYTGKTKDVAIQYKSLTVTLKDLKVRAVSNRKTVIRDLNQPRQPYEVERQCPSVISAEPKRENRLSTQDIMD
jgi:hypothetical protein